MPMQNQYALVVKLFKTLLRFIKYYPQGLGTPAADS